MSENEIFLDVLILETASCEWNDNFQFSFIQDASIF